jgi:membrane associated rhomboid family serine protease
VPCQLENRVTIQPPQNLSEGNTARTRKQMFNVPTVIVAVIAVLVLIHGAIQWGGLQWQVLSQYAFAFIPARFGPLPFPQLSGSAYWSFLTYGFLHADWTHLGFNCLWLVIFSKPVALRLGTVRYLALLALTIIAGAFAGLVVHWGQFVVMVGISAGVSGMVAAAIPIMYAGHLRLNMDDKHLMAAMTPLTPLQIVQSRPALMFTLLWLGLTTLTATSQYLTGTAFLEERVVAWEAHLGGFIAGFIAFYLLDRTRVSP